ncbi:uncharacterized protein Tco025E_01112 [Trypanosoma conorhini]|uniref:Uncharacterized protein n=1 Tax=Trypanosoma conorhini TaxID=83891 RepID=A0A422Q9K5_9TRYP|nr:uncharacterized protein Tco025E_01112 [Trypanosoma conorhini]RNF26650.1 hypothetical protein Tco025E_01112 [Trypanosoma conorhini]
MPMLQVRPDALPPVTILGAGPLCGLPPRPLGRDVIELRGRAWAASFAVSPALLPATEVHWAVTDAASGEVALAESFHVPTLTDGAGGLLRHHANSSYAALLPHRRYEVKVTVSRGAAVRTSSHFFLLRLPFDRPWAVERVAPQIHFGFERRLRVSQRTRSYAKLRAALLPQHPPVDYVGYWENAPLEDQPLPQTRRRAPHNPYTEDAAAFPVFVGLNNISFYARDVDGLCDPVLLETHEVWALQGILLQPSTSPLTACHDDIAVEALALQTVVAAARASLQVSVRFHGTTWEPVRGQDLREGRFECTERGAGQCHIRASAARGGTSGLLQMRKRGVADLTWVVRVEVNSTALVQPESLDAAVARVLAGAEEASGAVVVELRSRAAVVLRRLSTLPERVHVTLAMSLRRLKVHPPRSLEVAAGEAPIGRWLAAAPLRLHAVDDALVAEIDAAGVPNVRQRLPEGTLRFVAEDPGEAVDLGVPYTSRCPPRLVEHTVTVVALAAPPIAPALVPVYTEDSCVRLSAPRSPRKDEDARWHIPRCAEAAQSPPYLVAQERRQRRRRRAEDNASAPAAAEDEEEAAAVQEVRVCGVAVYRWCDVVWTARNLVGAVTQTFSLRRCQRPPQLLFHKDGLQQPRGVPRPVYALPSIEWLDEHDDGEVEGSGGTQPPRFTARRVVPVAGHAATLGYSFNYSGLQQDFAVSFAYRHDAAHQLGVTQRHFERAGDDGLSDEAVAAAPLLLRRSARPAADGDGGGAASTRDASPNSNANSHNRNSNLVEKDVVPYNAEAAAWARETSRAAREHDDAMDLLADSHFALTHRPAPRQVRLDGLGDSSHYPLLYEVRSSPTAAGPSREAAEFARRGLCVLQPGNFSVFAVSPRGAVPATETGVLPFCHPSFVFSRHSWLHTKYHFDFTWVCDGGAMAVERHTPTLSVLRHGGPANETRCSLTVRNALTETARTEAFLLRRVYPTPLPPTFAILSDNAAAGECFANGTARPTPTAPADAAAPPRRTRTRWVVGKQIILHVDAAVEGRSSNWTAVSVVPAVPSSVGTQRLLDAVHFLPLPRHPRALERGFGDATVLVSGIRVPGLYTFGYTHPDPAYPGACPHASLTETLHVVHAQVLDTELTVCGDTTLLRAVPIPREVGCEFFGQWEVVSLQTSETETWTSGTNFTGIRFEHGRRPRTVVHGLPFGVLTVRWAVYAAPPADPSAPDSGAAAAAAAAQQRRHVLVDFATVRLLVLTENLHSNRLVTLSHSVHILATTSTLQWTLAETGTAPGPLPLRGPRLRVDPVANTSGTGYQVVTVTNLPVGPTQLRYELHPSLRLFGPMLTKRCPYVRRQEFEIERVSAFLSANTTLSHECDAYSGDGQISICLHAEGARGSGLWSSSSASSFGARLVDAASFEAIVKAGAARLAARGCSLPWWVARSTRWSSVRADAARRCVSFTVAAARHLHPKEVLHHIFLAQEQLGSSRACAHGGDFMTSEIIDGATTWGDAGAARRPLFRGGEIVPFLPFLNAATLAREEQAMRPMLSLLGVPDTVASELDVSEEGRGVTVLLRLDTAQPRQAGGYVHAAPPDWGQQQQQQRRQRRHSLLAKCVRGIARGADVLNFWTEVNRPDGVEGRTAREWLDYVAAVREKSVACEPLFASLAHLLPRLDDTEASLRRRQQHRVPPKEQRLVPLDVIEQQLAGLQREYRWTREGIDVTGLRTDLQAALARRRITKSQLEEIERARRRQGGEKQQQTKLLDVSAQATLAERFERVLRLYKGVLDEDVAAVRLTLPRYDPFTVPHNLFLRTAVHKDVLCGTNVSAAGDADALVLFGRVEVVDVAPAVGATPAAIKQCEVEGGVPLIQVNVSGTTFTGADAALADRVVLEEVHNPNSTGLTDAAPEVGLLPCLQQMRAGMRVATSLATRKHLYLQLSPCPAFQMLSRADYDEQQDSELLQRKLYLSRLLRVTLRGVLAEDSHTRGKTSVSFVVEVHPTLARLHLRKPPAVGEAAASLPWAADATPRRPLLMCEADVRRHGVEFGVELIGDRWHERVGEQEVDADEEEEEGEDGYYAADMRLPLPAVVSETLNEPGAVVPPPSAWPAHGVTAAGARRRAPHNVALINSFSIVEHHRLDSAHHLLLRHGGLYRSDFVSYLSAVMARPESMRWHKFVYRYNDTFVGVRIPADQRGADDLFPGDQLDGAFSDDRLPPIRSFSTVEEILFAVPGIATECRGCLLADTTYFMAGDLTGLWFFPPATRPPVDHSALLEPLRVPFYAAPRVPREWRFAALCPTAAWSALQLYWRHWQPPRVQRGAAPYLQFELVVYNLRDILGGAAPLPRRPSAILAGAPVPLAALLNGGRGGRQGGLAEIVFQVNATAAERAHAMLAADFARYGRRHLHTVHDYLRDSRGSGGALAVNASVFLKVCVPPTAAVPDTQCSIVSLTHTLLVMEEPRLAAYYGQLRQGSWGSILHPAALLHHAGTALVGYILLPRLPPLRRALTVGGTRDTTPARTGLTLALFVAVVFLYGMATRLWAVICTLLWATLLCLVPEVIVGVYFLLHLLFWAFVM